VRISSEIVRHCDAQDISLYEGNTGSTVRARCHGSPESLAPARFEQGFTKEPGRALCLLPIIGVVHPMNKGPGPRELSASLGGANEHLR